LELLAGDRLQVVQLVEVAANNAFDFGKVTLGDAPEAGENIKNAVVRQRVIDELALTPRF